MMRCELIAALGASAVAWPVVAKGQTQDRIRRVGVLIGTAEDDPEARAWLAGFGRVSTSADGRRAAMSPSSSALRRSGRSVSALAKELVASQPDVILAMRHRQPRRCSGRAARSRSCSSRSPTGWPWLRRQPATAGGNLTGMLTFEEGVTGKWLAMLKEVAPHLDRVAWCPTPRPQTMTTSYGRPRTRPLRLRSSCCPPDCDRR